MAARSSRSGRTGPTRQLTDGHGIDVASHLVAGRDTHRVPPLGRRGRLGRRDGRRRRRTDRPSRRTHRRGLLRWQLSSLAWSPDGTSLIFPTRDGCAGGFDLNVVADRRLVAGDEAPRPGMDSVLRRVVAGRDPDRLPGQRADRHDRPVCRRRRRRGCARGRARGRLVRPDLGPNLDEVWPRRPPVGDVVAPAWSPDGTEVAVTEVTAGFFLVEAEVLHRAGRRSGERLLAEERATPLGAGRDAACLPSHRRPIRVVQRPPVHGPHLGHRRRRHRRAPARRARGRMRDGASSGPPTGPASPVALIASTAEEPPRFHLGCRHGRRHQPSRWSFPTLGRIVAAGRGAAAAGADVPERRTLLTRRSSRPGARRFPYRVAPGRRAPIGGYERGCRA